MTGTEIRDALAAAVEPLREDIKRLGESINGNGHLGLKGRLTRVETILALVGAIAITGTSMASCGIANKIISVPGIAGSR